MNAKKSTPIPEPAWPPLGKSNPDLIGQSDAEQTLIEAFHSGRMAHAWMICGPKGIGKSTLAYRFARYVLSQRGAEDAGPSLFGDDLPAEPSSSLYTDPQSPVFQRVAAGGHGDLLSIQRSLNDKGKLRSEIVVDNVREVGGFMSLTASEGGWRIVVIDSADEMNRNAANAVLKVLEEPPDRAVLLLVAHNPGRLLPTIRSRCRKLNLCSIGTADMGTLLHTYAPQLNDADTLKLIELADGSIGRAVDLIEAGGIDLYRNCLGLLATLSNLNMANLHELADLLSRVGADDKFNTAMNLLRGILARLLRYKAEGVLINDKFVDEIIVFERISPAAGLDRWLEVWEKVCFLLDRAEAVNLDRKQVVLNVFLEIDGALRNS
ncbi:MAG: DNA polymerase III subunit delta' [Rhodospirillales bacterium]